MVAGFTPGGFPESRVEKLTRIDEGHFWAESRDELAGRILADEGPVAPDAMVELGCGTGRFLPRLALRGASVCGVDGHLGLLQVAAGRARAAQLVQSDVVRLPLAGGQFDVAVALDVLEHVDPRSFLDEVARVLRPGGGFLVSVPAFPFLWSRLDEAAGHRCRYTVGVLRNELGAAGFDLVRWTHYQFLLFPLVALSRLAGRRREVGIERRPPPWLDRTLAGVNRFEVRHFTGWRLPVGSSLVAWASLRK